jgi:hypothetical protein
MQLLHNSSLTSPTVFFLLVWRSHPGLHIFDTLPVALLAWPDILLLAAIIAAWIIFILRICNADSIVFSNANPALHDRLVKPIRWQH